MLALALTIGGPADLADGAIAVGVNHDVPGANLAGVKTKLKTKDSHLVAAKASDFGVLVSHGPATIIDSKSEVKS